MNVVHLQGWFTSDPLVIYIESKNTQKTLFNLEVNELLRGDDGEYIEYTTCVAWDSGARLIKKFFTKGQPITVHGKIINEKDGSNVSKTMVRVTNFEFPLVEKINDTQNRR